MSYRSIIRVLNRETDDIYQFLIDQMEKKKFLDINEYHTLNQSLKQKKFVTNLTIVLENVVKQSKETFYDFIEILQSHCATVCLGYFLLAMLERVKQLQMINDETLEKVSSEGDDEESEGGMCLIIM